MEIELSRTTDQLGRYRYLRERMFQLITSSARKAEGRLLHFPDCEAYIGSDVFAY